MIWYDMIWRDMIWNDNSWRRIRNLVCYPMHEIIVVNIWPSSRPSSKARRTGSCSFAFFFVRAMSKSSSVNVESIKKIKFCRPPRHEPCPSPSQLASQPSSCLRCPWPAWSLLSLPSGCTEWSTTWRSAAHFSALRPQHCMMMMMMTCNLTMAVVHM